MQKSIKILIKGEEQSGALPQTRQTQKLLLPIVAARPPILKARPDRLFAATITFAWRRFSRQSSPPRHVAAWTRAPRAVSRPKSAERNSLDGETLRHNQVHA